MKNSYRVLSQNVFSFEEYTIVPIRYEDRYDIMRWRNQQIYHLRQKNPLTKADQNQYFSEIIIPSYSLKRPKQILFSFLKSNKCIGYGGLVHIDWKNKSGEISFIIQTSLESEYFSKYWNIFLNLIKETAFKTLNFNKLKVYSYELRPLLYDILKTNEFLLERRIKNFISINNKKVDALIHSLEPQVMRYRKVKKSDSDILFQWVNDHDSLKYSLNNRKVEWDEHIDWLNNKLNDTTTKFYIFQKDDPVGQVRLDLNKGMYRISFSVDRKYRGSGIGSKMLENVLMINPEEKFYAEVIQKNKASNKIFINLGFNKIKKYRLNGDIVIKYVKNEICRFK